MPSMRDTKALRLVPLGAALLTMGTGCDRLFGLDRLEPDVSQENAHVCSCTCFAGTRNEVSRSFSVCNTPAQNPNLDGGVAPSADDLAADCSSRVRGTMVGILAQCGSNQVKKALEDDPNACVCTPQFVPSFVESCNGACMSVPLEMGCSNQTEATQVGSSAPLCIAEPGTQPMGRVLFGDRSICNVSGTLAVVRGDDDPVSEPAGGVIELAGRCSPGTSCAAEVSYRLSDEGELAFDSFAGFASVTFRDIQVTGATTAPVTIDAAGSGEIDASGIDSSGKGTREDEEVFGVISDTRTEAYLGTNTEPIDVTADWANQQCSLVGSLIGAEIEGEDTDIVLDVMGTIVERPPVANAGLDQTVECTSPSGATVTLSAAASTDPDGDIRFRDWWIGHPGGTPIDDPENDGVVTISQALGATQTYALGIVDSHAAISQDLVVASVVDTTAPTISAVAASPSRVRPRNHDLVPVSVAVTSSDTCGSSTCSITAVSSNQAIDGTGDGHTSPNDWLVTGALALAVRAEASAGADRVYTIEVTCTDGSGNDAVRTVDVTVSARR